MVTRGNKNMSYYHALLTIYQPLTIQRGRNGIKLEKKLGSSQILVQSPNFYMKEQ